MAFLLHQRPYRDTSAIIDVFTRDDGRVTLVARGVRANSRRGQSNRLALFCSYWVSWAGKGEMPTLRQSEMEQRFSLSGDAYFAGLYANELLLRLCARHDPHPEIFEIYMELISNLESVRLPVDVSLRYFERDLLGELGYGLNLLYEQSGREITEAGKYEYRPESGLHSTGEGEVHAGLSGAAIIALAEGRLDDEVKRREARQLMRLALKNLLGERPLKSLDTLKRMKALQGKTKGTE